jgi:hypothetical protein
MRHENAQVATVQQSNNVYTFENRDININQLFDQSGSYSKRVIDNELPTYYEAIKIKPEKY